MARETLDGFSRLYESSGRLFRAVRQHRIDERTIRVGTDRFYVDSVDRLLGALAWKFGLSGAGERALIEREVRPGMVAVDVGASIGLLTLRLARRVGPAGRVYALEPEPRNFHLLSRAVADAALTQVSVHQAAAADRRGWIPLYVSAVNAGDHRTFESDGPRQMVSVLGIGLDDLLATEGHVDIVKISACGAEASVLRGLHRTIARNPDLRILCVVRPDLLRRAGVGAAAFFSPLTAAGFVPHQIARDGRFAPIHPAMAWSTAVADGRVSLYFRRATPATSSGPTPSTSARVPQ